MTPNQGNNKKRDLTGIQDAAGRVRTYKWWPETGLNRRRRPFQGRALPLSYLAPGQTLISISTPGSPAKYGSETSAQKSRMLVISLAESPLYAD